jgi:hypothetical protein
MLDQIKDSGRMVVDVAQASEYYYYQGTLPASSRFDAPAINTQGKARVVLSAYNHSSSPGSISLSLNISHNSNMYPTMCRWSQSIAANSTTNMSDYLPAQYIQLSITSSSTSGTYTYYIWLAIHPVS